MQQFQGFCGPTYYFQNKYAAVERCVNWYPVINEFGNEEGKFQLSLDPSPGNAAFSQLPVPSPFNQPNRGLIELQGNVYGVNGNRVFSLSSSGGYNLIGNVASDGYPCRMVANGNQQVFIASAGHGYVIPKNGGPGSLVSLDSNPNFLGASDATFQDGYILVVTPNSNQFQISGSTATPLGDATQWDSANVSVQSGQADNLRAILSSREYIRLFGFRRSQVYQNVGANGIGGFPFQSYNETFIETGCAATFSIVDLGNALIWLGEDARGQRACWIDTGFNPQRVSNFSVEQHWQNFSRIDDAIAFAYIWRGHLMYQITFPSAQKLTSVQFLGETWVYDHTVSTLMGKPIWHERTHQAANGMQVSRPEVSHCFAFGKHLVGSNGLDGNPGAVYQYSDTTSVGLTTNPQLILKWSNDGGESFLPVEYDLTTGMIGQYSQRVYLTRCGYARDRVFWVRCTDYGTDCGADSSGAQTNREIIRDRICPHIWNNNKRIMFNRIEFELLRGDQGIGLVAAELDVQELAS